MVKNMIYKMITTQYHFLALKANLTNTNTPLGEFELMVVKNHEFSSRSPFGNIKKCISEKMCKFLSCARDEPLLHAKLALWTRP